MATPRANFPLHPSVAEHEAGQAASSDVSHAFCMTRSGIELTLPASVVCSVSPRLHVAYFIFYLFVCEHLRLGYRPTVNLIKATHYCRFIKKAEGSRLYNVNNVIGEPKIVTRLCENFIGMSFTTRQQKKDA